MTTEKLKRIKENLKRYGYLPEAVALTVLAEIDRLRTMSIVEMMCENENVNQHVTEWERRCLKAEARVEELEALADHDAAIMPTPKRNP